MPRTISQIRDEYYSLFQSKPLPKKEAKQLKDDQLYNLFQKPSKPTIAPHYTDSIPGTVYQADLLFLPDDKGFRYALVCVDIVSKITDAEPIKNKEASTVKAAFQKMFKRKILKSPTFQIIFDAGSEFKGVVKSYFENDLGVIVKYAKAGRSNQLAFAENRNRLIGTALFKRMVAQQLITGQLSSEWVDDLHIIIKAMNAHFKTLPIKAPVDSTKKQVLAKQGEVMLSIGTPVRIALDKPMETTGTRLHGKFRATDIRFDPEPHEITNIILLPGQPVMYSVDDVAHTSFTRNQLQVIPSNEYYPPADKVLRSDPGTYMIENILEKKKIKNKIMYKVKWVGYNSTTWESKQNILANKKNIKLFNKFEKSIQNQN